MKMFIASFAICCLLATAKAKPGYDHGGHNLEGIPDIQSFGNIHYPKYDILDLGEFSKGQVPPTEIHESKHVTVSVPEPYPVKIPVPHPYPVPVAKPYPVVETKYIKVPHAVPYEIVKKVPFPVEVPKPYPVPVHGHSGGLGGGFGDSYHAGSENQEQSNDVGNLGGDGGQHISTYEAQSYQSGTSYGGDEGGEGGQGDWQGVEQEQEEEQEH